MLNTVFLHTNPSPTTGRLVGASDEWRRRMRRLLSQRRRQLSQQAQQPGQKRQAGVGEHGGTDVGVGDAQDGRGDQGTWGGPGGSQPLYVMVPFGEMEGKVLGQITFQSHGVGGAKLGKGSRRRRLAEGGTGSQVQGAQGTGAATEVGKAWWAAQRFLMALPYVWDPACTRGGWIHSLVTRKQRTGRPRGRELLH